MHQPELSKRNRCCSMSRRNSSVPYHQCLLSESERDEVNNPEKYPGITWLLNPYKGGKCWVRVVKPTYGCSREELINGRCTCVGGKKHASSIRDLDGLMTDAEISSDVVPTSMKEPLSESAPFWSFLPWHRYNRRNPDVVNEVPSSKAMAYAVWNYIVDNRDTYSEWNYHFPSHVIEKLHPIVRVINDEYLTNYTNLNIDCKHAHALWLDILGRPDLTKMSDDTRTYQKLIKPLISKAKALITPFEMQNPPKVVEPMAATNYDSIKLIDGKWTIHYGNEDHEIKLGGLPKNAQLVIEPFYRFDASGHAQIKVNRGALNPVTITIGADFLIKNVVRTDTGDNVTCFSVCEDHVLLDLIIVRIQASSIFNGHKNKAR